MSCAFWAVLDSRTARWVVDLYGVSDIMLWLFDKKSVICPAAEIATCFATSVHGVASASVALGCT